MEMNDYQAKAEMTRLPTAEGIEYTTLGLVGEAGEIANKVKKIRRDGTFDKEALVSEVGDVLWYAAMLLADLGVTLEDAARVNLDKLASRAVRAQIPGEGDKR